GRILDSSQRLLGAVNLQIVQDLPGDGKRVLSGTTRGAFIGLSKPIKFQGTFTGSLDMSCKLHLVKNSKGLIVTYDGQVSPDGKHIDITILAAQGPFHVSGTASLDRVL